MEHKTKVDGCCQSQDFMTIQANNLKKYIFSHFFKTVKFALHSLFLQNYYNSPALSSQAALKV